ncbi:MAG: DNA-binding MarR family transcriptional regulator [Crocinitomix sp.]|jgi:DNA-binding MarR family transcriptional regulator
MEHSVFGLDEQNANLSSKIVVSLEKISEVFRILLWQQAKTFGLSPIQIQILIFIQTHESHLNKVSYLAKEFNLTKATISDAVRVLEQKELINKLRNDADSRSFSIVLTPNGTAVSKKVALFSNSLKTTIEGFSSEKQSDLWGSLLSVLVDFQSKGVLSLERMCLNCKFHSTDGATGHYCEFLKQSLEQDELRIDCPEHEMKQ